MRLFVPALLGVVLSLGCGGGGGTDQSGSSGGSSSGGSSSGGTDASGGSSSGGSSSGGTDASGGSSSGGSSSGGTDASGGSSSGGSSSGGTDASTGGGAVGGTGGDQGEVCAPGWSDDSSGLCWYLGVDGAMNFDDAKAYCQSLEGGLAGWRMPTVDELKAQIVGCDPVTDCEVSTTCVECPCGDDLDSCRPPSACAYLEGPGPAGCYWDNA